MLTSGTRLAQYEILHPLGAGGMGEVYKARDTRLQRDVAIKVLPPGSADDPVRIHRFEQEARSASGLNHPNILTIHDVGREGDTVYYAMEWVDGQTLRAALASGQLPLRRTLELCQQVAEGLAKAHAAGIVHRDLKPENVMVSSDGFAKIVDFGLAKFTEASTPAGTDAVTVALGTTPGLVMGTVGYMSPEQATGRPVDYRSDQFALGLLIYELTTGKRPFERPTAAQTIAATIETEPEPIDRLNPQVPAYLAAVVARCLAKDPAERYESTRDLARDLKQVLTQPRDVAAIHAARPRFSTQQLTVAGLIVLVIAAAVIAAWSWPWSRPVESEPQQPLLAVRPLRNLSPDPNQGYFAAGMTEEIRGQLSQVRSLRILSANAVNAYDDGEAPRMARELGVHSVVEGSVRVDGKRVRITAELIDAARQQTLWSEQYDRDLADVFAVQSDVAVRIAQALQANLSPNERQRITRRPTENLEAYQLYLQSQELEMSERAENLKAIELLQKATALDPRFAVAQARLGYHQIFMAYYDDPSWIEKGLAEANAALRVDPSLAAAHGTLAFGYQRKGLDAQARLSYLRALELNPNMGGNNLSIHEATFGRFEESLVWARRAFALSGKRGFDHYHIAVPLLGLRDDALSRWWITEGQRRSPAANRLTMMLATLEALEGRTNDAIDRLSTALSRSPDDEELKLTLADVAFLADAPDLEKRLEPLMKAPQAAVWVAETVRLRYAYMLAKRGETARAAQYLTQADQRAHDRIAQGDETPDLRVELAAVSALRKNHDAALQWLSRAYDSGYRHYGLLERDPIFAPLRGDSRLREILDRMRRDVDAQRERARERGLLDLQQLIAAK